MPWTAVTTIFAGAAILKIGRNCPKLKEWRMIFLAARMDDDDSTCAALLQDVIEDHDDRYSFEYLSQAGFPESVIHALRLLTHTTGVPYMDYVKELAKDPIARKVKLADLKHNLDARRLNTARPRKYDLYLQAIRYLEEIEQKPYVK